MNFTHTYIITSERGFEDETDIIYKANKEYKVGDTIILDGIYWVIVEVRG